MPLPSFTPPQVPVVVYSDPNKTDRGLIEYWNTETTYYQALDLGAPHPNTRDFPGFRLGIQTAIPNNEKWIKRVWVSDQTNPDWFNYEIKYASESNNFPTYIRQYRETKKTYTPLPKGQPLSSVIQLNLLIAGDGYTPGTFPNIDFASGSGSGAAGYAIVNLDGTIADLVLSDGGTGYTSPPSIVIDDPTIGTTATGTAQIQPQTAILTSEHAEKFPEDSEFFGLYFNVTRVYETLPGPTLVSTKLDEKDGVITTVSTTRKLCSDIVTEEDVTAGIWTKTISKETDIQAICEEIVTQRAIPGFPMQSTKLDPDGVTVNRTQTYTQTSACVTSETLVGGTWTHKYFEDVDGTKLVSWQVVETRPVPGNYIPSAKINDDEIISTATKRFQAQGSITPSVTNPSALNIVTTEKEPVSDLVSYEVVTNTAELDRAVYSKRIPESIIPIEFRATIPTTTEVHILGGTAAMPTLGVGEFFREERQYKKLLKQVTVENLGGVSLPITQTGTETSEEYGGAVLDVDRTLSGTLLTADQGEDIVASYVNPIGQNLMWFKETKKRPSPDAVWPILDGTHVDPRYGIIIDLTKQVVNAGTVGGIDMDGTIREVQVHDKWRSIQLTSKLDTATLPAPVTWFSGQRHSFPPELIDAVIDWAEAICGCSDSFSAALIANLAQYSGSVKTRITEQFYNGVPPDDVTITQFCPQTHSFGFAYASACGSTDGDCRTKSGSPNWRIPLCLHGDLSLSVGSHVWTFPATSPPFLPHGTYIMLTPHVERWRFGVFRRVLTEAFVPVCGGVGGVGGTVFKADGAAGDSYLTKDFGSDYDDVWVTFDLGFTAAALFSWDGGGSGNFINVLSSSDQNIAAVYDIDTSPGVYNWFVHGGSSSNESVGPPPPAASVWQTCEMHIHKTSNTVVHFYVNHTEIPGFTDTETYGIRKLILGLQDTSGTGADNIAYFRNVKVGTTRGGIEIFHDDFTGGDFSNWDSATGTCSLVANPF